MRLSIRAGQLRTLTQGLEGYFPEGSLQEFLANGDWSDDKFNAFLGTFTGEKGSRAHQVAVTNMKSLKQISSQVPYFGGSIEYEQNERGLEYYIYHISTLTRDSEQQYGVDSDQGSLPVEGPEGLSHQRRGEGARCPEYTRGNLGEGATDEKMTFEGWPPELRKRAEVELNRLRTDPRDGDAKQVEWLQHSRSSMAAAVRQDAARSTILGRTLEWSWSQ